MNAIHLKAAIVAAVVSAASGASAQQGPIVTPNPTMYVDQLQISSGVINYPQTFCGGQIGFVFNFTPPFDSAPNVTAGFLGLATPFQGVGLYATVNGVTADRASVTLTVNCGSGAGPPVTISYTALGRRAN